MNLFKPYKLSAETASHVVYEFKTGFLYILYGILCVLAVGLVSKITGLQIAGGVALALYFLLVSTQYLGLNKMIKQAAREGSVEYSGSKWSFTNPVRVKLPRKST